MTNLVKKAMASVVILAVWTVVRLTGAIDSFDYEED